MATTPLVCEHALMVRIEIPLPDDWHVHLRDDAMLAAVVEHSARRYRYAMVMPNLRPPVQTTKQATAYRDRIAEHVPSDAPWFTPVMTLFASPELDMDDLARGADEGVVRAVKFYPPGATTNADQAAGQLSDLDELLDTLVELDMRLLVHAESTRPEIDLFDREATFLEDHLAPACARHPELKVTLEHVSTRAGVHFVRDTPNVAASVTPHHLSRTRSDLLADGMRPDLYCKPVINTRDDQRSLIEAATSGDERFFLGTDSAPHPTTAKYAPKVAAGIFNAPYGLEVVAETFYRADALEHLAAFVSHNGVEIYGVEPSTHRVMLERGRRSAAPAERLRTSTGDEVVFFGLDEAELWTCTVSARDG